MKLYHVKTYRRKPYILLVEDILCEFHWNKCKELSVFKSDSQYKIKVDEINSEDKCKDCNPDISYLDDIYR